jgi:serine-type D-Ala-D-Ala carboxypeptidase/endopeptidase (penicillin-binding protein 4)
MRRGLAVGLALLLVAGGYAGLDIEDRAPGILTLDPPPAGAASSTSAPAPVTAGKEGLPAVAVPLAEASPASPLRVAGTQAPVPAGPALAKALAAALADPGLGRSLGVTVRDAATGVHLLDRNLDRPGIPASTTKLLTATAVMATMDPRLTMATRAVTGATSHDVVLVAGGDTLLAPGRGTPTAVAGRAGLDDLARQTAAALTARGVGSIRLHLDDRLAPGPRYAPAWEPVDIAAGLTGAVAMMGLSTQRPRPGTASPADPAMSAARVFRSALGRHGIRVAQEVDRTAPRAAAAVDGAQATGPVTATATPPATPPSGTPAAVPLGEVRSAPLAEVLALALADSDNALTESLARQAAAHAGRSGAGLGFAEVARWVRQQVRARGVDVSGVTMLDTSGLSRGTVLPVRVLGDVLALAARGTLPGLREVVAGLPVAGLTGTLHDRFRTPRSHPAAGIARAKTGTLSGASALAGTVVDRDGRLLLYVVMADEIPPGVGTLTARAALDRFVATLATCGCR